MEMVVYAYVRSIKVEIGSATVSMVGLSLPRGHWPPMSVTTTDSSAGDE